MYGCVGVADLVVTWRSQVIVFVNMSIMVCSDYKYTITPNENVHLAQTLLQCL